MKHQWKVGRVANIELTKYEIFASEHRNWEKKEISFCVGNEREWDKQDITNVFA